MDYKGLEKTFGIKIPIYEHVDYYIETLKKSAQYKDIDNHINLFKDYEQGLQSVDYSVKNHKIDSIKNIISHLSNIGYIDKLNNWQTEIPSNYKYESIGFVPKEDNMYVSVDIKEANWTVSKYLLGYGLPNWEQFLSDLGYHNALAKSKTFRQYVLGNTNPKKISSMLKYITIKHIEMFPVDIRAKIVMVSEDEIIFKIDNADEVKEILNLNWLISVKEKIFKVNFFKNYNDYVRIDTIYDNSNSILYRTLKNINGNRFFLHFKTLILNEELDDRDLLFLNDQHIAKWII